MNNAGGLVYVWAVTGVDERQLIESGSAFSYCPARIPASQVALIERPAKRAVTGPHARATRRQRKQRS